MINKLKLSNFQCHKKTTFDFNPGITVITGESDVGKSAVIRALKWTALNKPPGESIRRHNSKVTSVTLDAVTKLRSASKHQYSCNGKVYKALRSDVPSPIADELRLSAVNFQGQHDAYFLIGDSPGSVARELNEVADLQIIDSSLKQVKQLAKALKAQQKQLEAEAVIIKLELQELSWTSEAHKLLQTIEAKEEQAAILEGEIITLREKFNSAVFREEQLTIFPDTAEDISAAVAAVLGLSCFNDNLANAIKAVEDNQVNIPDTSDDILQAADGLRRLGGTPSDPIQQALDNIKENEILGGEIEDPSGTLIKLEQATSAYETVSASLEEATSARLGLREAEAHLESAEIKMEEAWTSAGVCPLCGGKT